MKSRPLGLLVSVAAAALFMGSLLLEEVKGAGGAKLTDCDTSEEECTEFFETDFPKQIAGCMARKKTDGITNICTFYTANVPEQGINASKPVEPGSGCKKAAFNSTCDKLCLQDNRRVYGAATKVCIMKQQGWKCTTKDDKSKIFCGCSRLADATKVKEGQKAGERCG